MSLPLVALALVAADPVSLDWRAPDGCPDRDAVLAALAALVDDTGDTRVHVQATTRRLGERHELDLRIRTASVALRRRLVADDCATLADATALIVAIVLDPLEVSAQVASEPAEPLARGPEPTLPLAVPVPEPAAPPPRAAEPPAPAPAEPRPPRTRGFVRLEAALDAGATPGVAADVAGALGLLRARLRLELHGLYTAPHELSLGTSPVGRLARWAVGARACGRILQRRLEIPLCGGLEAGQFLATGAGITLRPLTARTPWFALLASLGLVWSPHPRVGLGGRADLVVAPLRAQFTVGDEVVHTAEVAGVRVALGVEVRLDRARTRARRGRDGSAASRPQP